KETSHAAHAVEERRGEARVAKKMIVEKVEVSSRQPVDLGQRIVDALCVERAAALKERVLVAEVAVLRASARDDDRVRDEVTAAADQMAAGWGVAIDRTGGRLGVERARRGGPEGCESLRGG